MLIPCPVCGPRDHGEFTYFGSAAERRPDIADADPEVWARYVYDRENPRGPHEEFWHHTHGCRHWLVVRRDTQDHDIFGARLVGPWAAAETGAAG